MTYKAVIIDDHPLILESLELILDKTGLFTKIYQFSSLNSFYENFGSDNADCYLIDISLGSDDGREIIKWLRKNYPQAKIIAISSHDNPKIIQSAFKSGADSYLLKSSSVTIIEECIASTMEGIDYIAPEVQRIINTHLRNQHKINKSNFPELSERELEVLQLIAEEFTSKEIGAQLYISEHTVESHRASLLLKFGAKNLAGLIRKAMKAGIID